MADKENDEIRVEDRRHFDREGNLISADQPAEAPKRTDSPKTAPPEPPPQKIDFVTVLFSFVHTALIHLGDAPDPVSKKSAENLDGAQEMIEILELLQEKTKGNLNHQEQQYLDSALFDLRMRYMQKRKLIK